MRFKPLHPDAIRRVLATEVNCLSDLHDERLRKIKAKPCPRCRSALHPFVDALNAFSQNSPLPRTMGRCTECELVWDPEYDMIHNVGNGSLVRDPIPTLRTDER